MKKGILALAFVVLMIVLAVAIAKAETNTRVIMDSPIFLDLKLPNTANVKVVPQTEHGAKLETELKAALAAKNVVVTDYDKATRIINIYVPEIESRPVKMSLFKTARENKLSINLTIIENGKHHKVNITATSADNINTMTIAKIIAGLF